MARYRSSGAPASRPYCESRSRSAAEYLRVEEFDDRFLARRHGFEGAMHYYTECAAGRFLNAVTVPTLIIHAQNDPWIPAEPYLAYDWSRNPKLKPLLPHAGGHVGFHDAGYEASWHDRCAADFFAAH